LRQRSFSWVTGESGWLSLRSAGAGGAMLVTGCWDAGSDVGFMGSVGMGWFWLGVGVGLQISDWMFQNVKCDISGVLWGVFSVQ